MAGNITIIEAHDRFVKVPREIVSCGGVTLQAVGLYATILALGNEWKLNVRGLATYLDISVPLVTRYLSQLEKSGYLRRTRSRGSDGRLNGWDYEISSTPFTDTTKSPTSEKTDTRKNRHSEKPSIGETDTRKNEAYNKDYKENKDNKVNKDNNQVKTEVRESEEEVFDFRKSLIGLGVPAALVDEWLKVRHTRRLTNTRTAFEAVAREIAKSGRGAEDCIRFVVERSWGGFKAEWLNEDRDSQPRNSQPAPRRQESLVEHWERVDREIEEILPGYGKQRTDNQ